MKTPLQATPTMPPGVEYVAVGRDALWVVGGPAGRVEGGAPGTVVDVAGDEAGVMVAPGCGACEPGAGDTARVVVVADPRPGDGTVEVVPCAWGAPGAALAADEPDASSLTTSAGARTAAGRSVTSAATMDVAAQTITVEAIVTASQSPAAKNRDRGILRGCPLCDRRGLSEP